MGKTNPKLVKRLRRKKSIRKRISGTAERPRLTVFRSARHIYAQLVDDEGGQTLAAASTLDAAFKETGAYGGNKQAAAFVGKLLAERALERGIKRVVFDRNGYLFHGRVKSLADAAREAGLDF